LSNIAGQEVTTGARVVPPSFQNVTSVDELERKIATGEPPELSAWEDTIIAENLTTRVTEIDRYLKRLQEFGQARN
jgi:hypothetical protein